MRGGQGRKSGALGQEAGGGSPWVGASCRSEQSPSQNFTCLISLQTLEITFIDTKSFFPFRNLELGDRLWISVAPGPCVSKLV